MDYDSLGCPDCNQKLDERELISKSRTVESCPKCGATVRESDRFSGTNFAGLITSNVAAIDAWLDGYTAETSLGITKRSPESDGKIRWAIETSHDLAVECLFDEQNPRTVEVRGLTRLQFESVSGKLGNLISISAQFGFQPCHERRSNSNIDGNSLDGYWGMVQYINAHTLGTSLLCAIIERLGDAMEAAIADYTNEVEE